MKLHSIHLAGLQAQIVEIEIDTSLGIPGLHIIGLGSQALGEADQRIRVALKKCFQITFRHKITINLSPAELRKTRAYFDLPIALIILTKLHDIPTAKFSKTLFLGELTLAGDIRPLRSTLPLVIQAQKLGFQKIILPSHNFQEASLVRNIDIIPISHISQAWHIITGQYHPSISIIKPTNTTLSKPTITLTDIAGQFTAKRALSLAVAGRHHTLMIGPPGVGKSMLASAIPSITTTLNYQEQIQTTAIYSLLGKTSPESPIISTRPFRTIHHSITPSALIGGGHPIRPGEISLAHHGFLFLDELAEFSSRTLNLLRQSLEDQQIHIAKSTENICFPAAFTLIATTNPCPCGYYLDPDHTCHCREHQRQNYFKKISGPLLDRIDICLHLTRESTSSNFLQSQYDSKTTLTNIRQQIKHAITLQQKRFHSYTKYNAQMTNQELKKFCKTSQKALTLLDKFSNTFNLSKRSITKTLKLARTIADLADSSIIQKNHIQEALLYRYQNNNQHV